MNNYSTVGKGLQIVFISIVIGILAAIPIPFVSPLLAIAAPIVAAYGYSVAAKAHEDYRVAMYLTVANIILAVINFFVEDVFLLGNLVGLATTICSALVVYIVCVTTSKLLDECGKFVSPRGTTVWKLYLVCMLVVIVIQALIFIPILNLLAIALAVPAGIASIVGAILYIIFIWKAQQALQGA